MNRTEFMSQLKKNLSKLPVEERENAISYYTEYFDDAIAGGLDQNTNTSIDEQRIIEELGSPSKIASQIIGNYAVSDVGTSPKSAKKELSILWIVVLAIFASPIALPIAFGVVTLAFGVILAIFSFIFAFAIAAGACVGSGGLIIILGFKYIITSFDFATFFFFTGSGLLTIAIGIIFGWLTIFLSKKSFSLITQLLGRFLLRRNLA